jgi:hypothetical protein
VPNTNHESVADAIRSRCGNNLRLVEFSKLNLTQWQGPQQGPRATNGCCGIDRLRSVRIVLRAKYEVLLVGRRLMRAWLRGKGLALFGSLCKIVSRRSNVVTVT